MSQFGSFSGFGGAPNPSGAGGFNFGTPAATTAATAATPSTGGFSFGTSAGQPSTGTGFSFGASTAATTQASSFSFNAPASTSAPPPGRYIYILQYWKPSQVILFTYRRFKSRNSLALLLTFIYQTITEG